MEWLSEFYPLPHCFLREVLHLPARCQRTSFEASRGLRFMRMSFTSCRVEVDAHLTFQAMQRERGNKVKYQTVKTPPWSVAWLLAAKVFQTCCTEVRDAFYCSFPSSSRCGTSVVKVFVNCSCRLYMLVQGTFTSEDGCIFRTFFVVSQYL